jgi:toxin ParE1/3/4
MEVVFSPAAIADLEEIGDYIAQDSPARAETFVAEIRARCNRIADMPRAAPQRADLRAGIRMVPLGRYLIFYSIDDGIRIERILHGARDLPRLF